MTDDLAAAALLVADMTGLIVVCGVLIVLAGAVAVRRFAGRRAEPARHRPAVTILKPLCGDEPLLEAALVSICGQRYPTFQVVFGVHDGSDPALRTVARVRERFPACDITVVVDAALHGPNRKIGNLVNMLPSARHDTLVFSDSDLHVSADYLDRIVAALARPGVGLVTTLCRGLPTSPGRASRLGATGISHSFLPGALLARALGREDCLGTTMALRRDTLAAVGGLASLVRHLADDNVLAQRVRQLGLRVGLADTVPHTSVPEASLRALWQHELRWARTIRALEPVLYAVSTVQYPLFWASAAILLSGGSGWSVGLFAVAWLARAAAALSTDQALRRPYQRAVQTPIWLLPLRDVVSASQVAASYLGARVVWRGHVMHADDGRVADGRVAALERG